MKKITLLLLTLILVVSRLTGCSKYVSHYSAIGRVRTNSSSSGSVSFMKLDGTEVFKLKIKQSEEGAALRYSGKLETGSLTVYYDCDGTKKELFSIHSGEEVNSSMDSLHGDTVYVILETNETCRNGKFGFEIYYA